MRLTSWSYVWKRDESWSADQSNAFILFSSKRSGAGVLLFLSFGTPVSLNVALISRGLLSLLWPSNPIFFYWWPLLRERIRAREWATWSTAWSSFLNLHFLLTFHSIICLQTNEWKEKMLRKDVRKRWIKEKEVQKEEEIAHSFPNNCFFFMLAIVYWKWIDFFFSFCWTSFFF